MTLLAITNLFTVISGIILLPILTRTLTVEEYGIWVQIVVTIGLIPTLVTIGLPDSVVRFLAAAKKREKTQESFCSIAFVVLLTSAI